MLRNMRPKVPFKWRGKHHSYYGVAFMIFGSIMLWLDWIDPDRILWFWVSIIVFGAYMLVDDIIEHTITADTPLRILYEKVFRPIIRGW